MNNNGNHAAEETEELVDLCRKHLTDTHIQLWGRAFNIADPTSRQAAAEWLAEEISAVFA